MNWNAHLQWLSNALNFKMTSVIFYLITYINKSEIIICSTIKHAESLASPHPPNSHLKIWNGKDAKYDTDGGCPLLVGCSSSHPHPRFCISITRRSMLTYCQILDSHKYWPYPYLFCTNKHELNKTMEITFLNSLTFIWRVTNFNKICYNCT